MVITGEHSTKNSLKKLKYKIINKLILTFKCWRIWENLVWSFAICCILFDLMIISSEFASLFVCLLVRHNVDKLVRSRISLFLINVLRVFFANVAWTEKSVIHLLSISQVLKRMWKYTNDWLGIYLLIRSVFVNQLTLSKKTFNISAY